ncbi:hypothetical protein MSG28_005678 [Choristoneura fumiferana]|uniref:Uncharacterized protein n=1 Tax=Choristoneura fumiferana TaxID=7141 RepID=A0ACC0KZL5_CHOFU|nr:hypothetical protein MSG28_005678 [Choristoneura fumiferana]
MTDSKYFTTTKKGEIFELKSELNSDKKEKKKEAVKKVIASMTVGKDVSALFPDVVNCMQTDNLELKKLVYLYLMNYAKSQPDMAIMAVNTFVKDCEDSNPLIRALAVRTMGCIRVDKITEYLCEPLRKCLKDEDPYVRKTAAVCVAKLYDISSSMVEDQGFLDQLKDLLSDSNPMVVANAVAALSEINEASVSGHPLVEMNAPTINKLLTALNECTEWGQVFILDALSNYSPRDAREAHSICERITRASRMPTPPSCSPPSRYARVGHAAPERAAVLDTGRARRLLAARRTPSASASRRASRMPTPPSCSPPSRYARVGHAAPERAAVLDTGRARRLLAARRTPSASASRRARACQRRRRALRRQGTPAWGTQRRERAAVLDTGREATPGREAHSICERITPRLAHANAAVVLSAVKVRPRGARSAGAGRCPGHRTREATPGREAHSICERITPRLAHANAAVTLVTT